MNVRLYFLNLLIGIDECANTALGGGPSDTISGRAARGRRDGYRAWTVLANFLDWLQKDHCKMALANDQSGRHEEAIPCE